MLGRLVTNLALTLCVGACAVAPQASPTLNAIEAVRRMPNLLDYPRVYGALGATATPYTVGDFVGTGPLRQPSIIGFEPALTRFADVWVDERVNFAGRNNPFTDSYAFDVAAAFLTLKPVTECIRLRDLTAFLGKPTSSEPAPGGGHDKPSDEEVNYSWTLVHTHWRLLKLDVARLGVIPTNDKILPGFRRYLPGSNLFGPPKTDCAWYGLSFVETRPNYRFSNIYPRPVVSSEPYNRSFSSGPPVRFEQ